MAILNYTTKIDSYKTITEIQKILSAHGASKTVIDNDSKGNPIALTFCITFQGVQQGFALPCNFGGVLASLKKDKKVPKNLCTEEQAIRIGWRIIKDWIEAQCAIIDAGMVDVQEVFLPYAITKSGNTLYHEIQTGSDLLRLGE